MLIRNSLLEEILYKHEFLTPIKWDDICTCPFTHAIILKGAKGPGYLSIYGWVATTQEQREGLLALARTPAGKAEWLVYKIDKLALLPYVEEGVVVFWCIGLR